VAFPRDVIANAPRILSDLNRFFPPEQGTFLIGPMAKIGWGTPTLISISLGVIIEIPGNIAVLGVLRAALPTADQPLLVAPGPVRRRARTGQVTAVVLRQALRLAGADHDRRRRHGRAGGLGRQPRPGHHVGGFHPAYRPPPLPFPVPDRLSVDLLNAAQPADPGVRLLRHHQQHRPVRREGRREARLQRLRRRGHLGFDALFQFSPFRFAIHISGDVSLKAFGVGAFGIDLDFQLEGPAPWRAHGRGSIGFLFFSVSADFDITWGEERDTTLPPVAVLPLLAAEIGKTEGWETRLPSGGNRALVTCGTLPDTDDLVLHPLGTLFVRQRALPLNVRVDRIGGQRASDGKRFRVAPVPNSGLSQCPTPATGSRWTVPEHVRRRQAVPALLRDTGRGLELTADKGAWPRPGSCAAAHATSCTSSTAHHAPATRVDSPRPHTGEAVPQRQRCRCSTSCSTAAAPAAPRCPQRQAGCGSRSPPSTRSGRPSSGSSSPTSRATGRRSRPSCRGGRPTVAATFRSRTTAQDALADFVDRPTRPGRAAARHPGVRGGHHAGRPRHLVRRRPVLPVPGVRLWTWCR
jgi:hypothetical protein